MGGAAAIISGKVEFKPLAADFGNFLRQSIPKPSRREDAMRRCVIWILPLLIASAPAAAQTLTAVCKGLSGRAMGVESSGAVVNEVDGMRVGQIVITWTMGAKTAQIVAQGFGDLSVTDTGNLVHFSDEQASFVVNYPAAVWLYSLFVRPKHLVVTRHTNGVADSKGGAIGNVLLAPCDVHTK